MARMPRLVVPGYPHHVTQRGIRCMNTFFSAEDYQAYLDLLVRFRDEAGVRIWAYCLMPNHVHLVVVPARKASLSDLFRQVHRRYTRRINFREDWRGHLWQERFHSFVMDERHLLAAVRYIELNPVRAGLILHPEDWRWSSVHGHLAGRDDDLLTVAPMLKRVGNWSQYLGTEVPEQDLQAIRCHSGTGRPAGDESFVECLEGLTGRTLKPGKPGRRPLIK